MPHKPPRWEDRTMTKPWQRPHKALPKVDRVNEYHEMLRYAVAGKSFDAPKHSLQGRAHTVQGVVRGYEISYRSEHLSYYHRGDDKWFSVDPEKFGWYPMADGYITAAKEWAFQVPDAVKISSSEIYTVRREGLFGLAAERALKGAEPKPQVFTFAGGTITSTGRFVPSHMTSEWFTVSWDSNGGVFKIGRSDDGK